MIEAIRLNIRQSLRELGLEHGAILAWAEPKAGQSLSPKFGRKPFPKKLIYSILLVATMDAYFFLRGIHLTPIILVLGSIALMVIAWPILKLLDRLVARNVWIYSDRILVTHSADQISIGKDTVLTVHIYKTKPLNIIAVEFQCQNNTSTVVAFPNNILSNELIDGFIAAGYPVSNGL